MMTVRRSKKWNVINVINFQKWCSLFRMECHFVAVSKICWHASNWSSISFSHWQCPSNGDIFLRFVGLLILSLSSAYQCPHCWGTGLPYGLHIKRTGHNPPRETDASWCVLTTANAAGTNGLTCLWKHGEARDNKFLFTHSMTDQRCITFSIARRSALTAGPSSSRLWVILIDR
jgi:hypothetical protein